MDQFDKKIKQKLTNAPRHEADPVVWAKVAGNLDHGLSSNRALWMRYLLATAALLAIAGSFFWLGTRYNRTKALEDEVQKMSKVIAELQWRDKNSTRIVDTLVVRDTIWQIYYPQGSRSQTLSSTAVGKDMDSQSPGIFSSTYIPEILQTSQAISSVTDSLLAKKYMDLLRNDHIIKAASSVDISSTRFTQEDNNSQRVALQTLPFEFSTLPSLTHRKITLHPYRSLQAGQIIKAEKSRRFLNLLLPDHYRIGLVMGGLNPLANEAEEVQEWVGGMQTEVFFGSRTSIISGIRYRRLNTKYEHELEEAKFPEPDGLLASDRIKEIYANASFVNIPLILKYSYPWSDKFYPFVYGGILFGGIRSQNYKFEIVRNGQEKIINSKIAGSAWVLNSVLYGIGMEYNPVYRFTFSADIEGRYQIKQSEEEYGTHHGLGLRLVIYYNL
ncbi:MAG: hypothetical protein KDC53_12130 [Saprospiraceae bacterium]|nr:hypothetical protein [Saprospiraceae bacterium]